MLTIIAAPFVLAACGESAQPGASQEASPMTDELTVTSTAFTDGGTIPTKFGCDGDDVSPPLAWSEAPSDAGGFALIVTDPDAGGFVHWIAADLPAERTSLAEGASGSVAGVEGRTSFGRDGYGGPCPPSGSHRYDFEVFALSETLNLEPGFSADELRSAMEGKVLASGRLSASYRRGGG
ncbi:MAG: YbhB/YbcL family Raf kinase inhibitor-like protein [Candidatus Limnocylindria bacterium]